MSIAAVLTGGFGSWGSASLVVTDGFDAGEPAPEAAQTETSGAWRMIEQKRARQPAEALLLLEVI